MKKRIKGTLLIATLFLGALFIIGGGWWAANRDESPYAYETDTYSLQETKEVFFNF